MFRNGMLIFSLLFFFCYMYLLVEERCSGKKHGKSYVQEQTKLGNKLT